MNPRHVLIINVPLVESPGKFVLVAGRMGTPTITFIDKLVGVEKDNTGRYAAYEGRLGNKTILRFPGDTPYMMLDRSRTEMLTPVEAAQANKIENEAVDKIWGRHVHEVEEEAPAHHGVYL